jgi:hypothetical protein
VGTQARYGSYGLPSAANDLMQSEVTESGYLCNLGAPRRRLSRIRVESTNCHIQIAGAAGGGYTAMLRGAQESDLQASIGESAATNETTRCRVFELAVAAKGTNCNPTQHPGHDPGCEGTCALVLFKGADARRLPIAVLDAPELGTSNTSSVVIDDRYLSLAHKGANDSAPDLLVTGANVEVKLSNARIQRVTVANQGGRIAIEKLRYDTLAVTSTDDTLSLEARCDLEGFVLLLGLSRAWW